MSGAPLEVEISKNGRGLRKVAYLVSRDRDGCVPDKSANYGLPAIPQIGHIVRNYFPMLLSHENQN